jgi:spermidine synthase
MSGQAPGFGPAALPASERPAWKCGAVASLDNVVMPSHQSRGNEPDGGQSGADGHVELLGDLDRPRAWMLLVDGVPQSHVDLDDPRHLELEYMRLLGHLIDLAAPAGMPLRVLHLGGGGLTLARYVAATRPGSSQLAVESSAEVAKLVRRRLPLDQPGRSRTSTGQISVRVADARAVLEQVPAGSFDVLVADVFAGAQTPAHLMSVEFTVAAARVLAPSGIYAANIGDGPPLAHARGRVAAVRSVFRHACVIAEAAVLRGLRFGNLVAAAADHELPVAGLIRRAAADPFPAQLVEGAGLDQFVAGSRPITDASAEPSPAPPPDVFADRRTGRHALLPAYPRGCRNSHSIRSACRALVIRALIPQCPP